MINCRIYVSCETNLWSLGHLTNKRQARHLKHSNDDVRIKLILEGLKRMQKIWGSNGDESGKLGGKADIMMY